MIEERYKLWTEDPYFDNETKLELIRIKDNPKEIEDRFYTDLEFGTGGLRGVLAAGTNRMNKYVIRKVTQGLAEYINEFGNNGRQRGVVIAYDSRKYSKEFALESALVLGNNEIKVYLFDSLRPTPELSFAVRHLNALAGIVITASHNPKEYNGYKVYWEDGGQVPPEQANRILNKIESRENWVGIETMKEQEALNKGLLEMIGEEVDQVYLERINKLVLYPEMNINHGEKLKIVYTPLHGAGNILVQKALKKIGFRNIFVVPEQEKPDPEFKTVPYPNPEIASVLDLALQYAQEQQADIILATDPDADRLGVMIKDSQGSFVQLTGNQIGVILEHYILSQKKFLGILPIDGTVVKTIASTNLAEEIANSFGVKIENVLIGFKYIGEKIKEMERDGWGVFQFGFEESNGYLAGDFVRDKDGIIASVLLSEASLYYKQFEGKTLLDVLSELYSKYGYYLEEQKSIVYEGKEGKEKMRKIMNHLREANFRDIGGVEIEILEDYEEGIGKNLSNGERYPLKLPRSNIIRMVFKEGGFVMVRPSGTEPKIKYYFSIKGKNKGELKRTLEKVKDRIIGIT